MRAPSVSVSTSFVLSILVHAAVFALLVTLSHRSTVSDDSGSGGAAPIEVEAASDAEKAAAEAEAAVFQGVPYSVYAKKTGKDMLTQGRAAKLMSALQTLNLSGGGRKAKPGLKSGLDKGTTGLVNAATSGASDTMTKSLQSRRFAFQATPQAVASNGARRMTDKERAELKRRFQSLEAEFRKVYSTALNQDPQLEVTVSFEAEIKPTGYLAVQSFKAQGKYQPESVALLRAKMSELVAKVFVAKDLAGTLIRGESVFVR